MHIRDIPPDTSGILRDETTEFSFILLPSLHDGVGVFCTHGIRKGTFLRLFSGPDSRVITEGEMAKYQVLAVFCRHYGIEKGNKCYIPRDFGCMEIGWYLNLSDRPNINRDKENRYFAIRDILAGEEITLDYGTL